MRTQMAWIAGAYCGPNIRFDGLEFLGLGGLLRLNQAGPGLPDR
jgi:hypothetical protein